MCSQISAPIFLRVKISIGFNVCKSEPRLVDILAYATTIALLCECKKHQRILHSVPLRCFLIYVLVSGAKFGLFLTTDICTDPAYWYNDESDSYSGSVCKIDRGAYMCISSMAAYFVSVIMAVGFAARPKRDAFSHEDESLTSWMGTENEQSAKAQMSPERRDSLKHNTAQSQYDWSRSAPSTIPSINNAEVEEDYGMEEHMDVLHEQFDEDDIAPIPEFPPHENRSSRRFDDTSTLTWDPGEYYFLLVLLLVQLSENCVRPVLVSLFGAPHFHRLLVTNSIPEEMILQNHL